MDDLKNKMYNYETTPPEGVWESIVSELDRNEAKVIPLTKKKNNTFYYVAAASVALIIFCVIFFANRDSSFPDEPLITSTTDKANGDTTHNNFIMTVPVEEKTMQKDNTITNDKSTAQNKSQKGGLDDKQDKDVVNDSDSNLLASNTTTRYMVIEGPQGQPVKVSSKMAMLIDSSETKVATKPIWNKKINEWKEIMKGNTLAPTTGNFLDIIELTKSLKDNK